jgi:Arc/MetJ-type ribon-helix-helix transcriptional regulator
VSGAAEPLLGAILRCTIRDVGIYFHQGRKPDALKELDLLETRLASGEQVATTAVMNALNRLSENLVSTGRSRGILLIVDELGKFLEYAARTQATGDVFLLQQLAEATNRSSSEGLYLVTILHQSFERYAAELRPAVREEWAKVQGRFEDVAFQEPPEQLLELISRALVVKQPISSALRPLYQQAKELAQTAKELDLSPRGMSIKGFVRALEHCAPLHPLTSLALVRLCRKFGQNQRSLFSFLTSREKHGFSSFLLQSSQPPSFFGLAELYDYLAEGFGSGLAVGESATRWAEIQSALDRAASLGEVEIRFIKTVGVLSAIGQIGDFKATSEVIRFALGLDVADFRRCKRVLAERSLIVERKHSGTIALWEGSDLDLDNEVRNAGKFIASNASLAEKLNLLWAPRPLVAKRHSFKTGTLRYFTVRFADTPTLSKSLDVEPGADGLLLYCLPLTSSERETLVDLASNALLQEKPEVLVAIPQEVNALHDAVRDLEALRYVQAHTRELEADAVARRELRARISAAESRVSTEVQRLFSPEEQTARETAWFHHGMPTHVPTSRTLADKLSRICDKVYFRAPILRNELVNRRNLSSAAAAARRNLLGAMITRQAEPQLGFTGTPPEVSIYSSILAYTGIHRLENGGYCFGAPKEGDALADVWQEITDFFNDCELKRHTLADLFGTLQRAPFGLKLGVIPILFCAAAMVYDTEIAFYECGAFLPEMTVDAFERLVRSPESFELRRYRIEGLRRDVYVQLAHLFGQPTPAKGESLLSVVKPLFRFLHRLPKYCQTTTRLSPRTLEVRSVLMNAKEPDELLFRELPRACEMEPFNATETDGERAKTFFVALRASITELQRAYEDLLRDMQELLFRAFDQPLRVKMQSRAQAVVSYCVEPRLKAVVTHIANEHMDDSLWIEAIATTIVGKAPKSWSDDDRVRFEIGLAEMSRNIRHLEELLYEERKRQDAGKRLEEVFRLGVSDRNSMEVGAVVVVEQHEQKQFMNAVLELQFQIQALNVSPQIALAALASVSQSLLGEYTGVGARVEEVVKHG